MFIIWLCWLFRFWKGDRELEVRTATYGPGTDQSQHAKSVSHIINILICWCSCIIGMMFIDIRKNSQMLIGAFFACTSYIKFAMNSVKSTFIFPQTKSGAWYRDYRACFFFPLCKILVIFSKSPSPPSRKVKCSASCNLYRWCSKCVVQDLW